MATHSRTGFAQSASWSWSRPGERGAATVAPRSPVRRPARSSSTALENVEAKLAPIGGDRERALHMLAEVGLAHRADHLPSHLSGGEQRRVAIARALSIEPRVVLADEPTGNLDTATGGEIIDLLASLAEQRGSTVIVATHDTMLAARAPRRVAMRDGRIAGIPSPAVA